MSQTGEGTVQAKDLDSWRAGLLRVVLTADATALVCSWLAVWSMGHRELAAKFDYVLILGGLLPLVGIAGVRFPRLTSWLFVFTQLLPMAHAILEVGWAPAVVVWLVFMTVFAGILIGKGAALLVVGGASAMFCIGGLQLDGVIRLFDAPPQARVGLPALDVGSLPNWITAALIFTCFNGASIWGVGRLFRLIEHSTRYHTGQVTLLRERHALLATTRFERNEKTEQLQDAQRFQMVTQLGRGFNQLFGETLATTLVIVSEARTASTERVSELAHHIIELVQHTASRSQDVLALLRPLPQPASRVDLSHTITAIAYRYRAQLRPSVVLEVDAPVQEHASVGEPWLEQVLLNLLLNSDRALGTSGGKITVQVRRLELETPLRGSCGTLRTGAYAVVRVCDSGPGIGRETATRAFEPFYSEWDPPHTGIGLTTVFEMSRQVGGTVEIESPSAGASVAVYVPLAQMAGEAPPSNRVVTTGNAASVEWKDRSLRAVAKWSAIFTAVSMSAVEVQRWFVPNGMLAHLILGIPLLVACAYVQRSKATYSRRLHWFLAVVLAAATLFTLDMGFMAPAGIAGLSLMTLLTRMLDSPRVSFAWLIITASSIVALGALRIDLELPTLPTQTSMTLASNWYRIAVSLPSFALIAALSVMNIVETARASIRQLAAIETSLSLADRQLTQEVLSVSNIDRITARASDLEALGRMTGAVAHDVNNSLQAVTAWASTLTAPNASDTAARSEALSAIEDAVAHAEALLADLDLNRQGPLQPAVVDLGMATQRLTRLLRALLGSKHTLNVEAVRDACVETNLDLYHRALFNLVTNARDAMLTSGTCAIRVTTEPQRILVCVEDDGVGMDELTKAQLFSTSFTTKGAQGHGLGLASVSALLSASNASADTWSEKGRGTRITLTFPRATKPLADSGVSPSTG